MSTTSVNWVQVDPGQSTISIDWEPVAPGDDADSYEFYYRTPGGSWTWFDWERVSTGVTSRAMSTSHLQPSSGSSYEIAIRTHNWPDHSLSAYSNIVPVTINPAPSGLTATSTPTSATLNWSTYTSTPFRQFDFYIQPTGGSQSWDGYTTTSSSTSYTFTSLEPDTTYTVGIRATQNQGTQNPNNPSEWQGRAKTWIATASITTQSALLDAPTLTRSTVQANQRTVEIEWDHTGQNLNSYEIFWRPHSTQSWTAQPGNWVSSSAGGADSSWIQLTGNSTYKERLLLPASATGTTVDLAVRATPYAGGSAPTCGSEAPLDCSLLDDADFTVAMATPQGPTAAPTSESTATIDWTASVGSQPFEYWDLFIETGSSLGSNPTPVQSLTDPSAATFEFGMLNASTLYTLGVRAVQSDGNPIANEPSVLTEIAAASATTNAATTRLDPPEVISGEVHNDERTMSIEFKTDPAAAQYHVRWRLAGAPSWDWVSCNGNGPNTGGSSPACSWVTGTGSTLTRDLTLPSSAIGQRVEFSVQAIPLIGGTPQCGSNPDCSLEDANAFAAQMAIPTITSTSTSPSTINLNWASYSSVPWAKYDLSIGQAPAAPTYVGQVWDMAATSHTFSTTADNASLQSNTSYNLGLRAVQSQGVGALPRVQTEKATTSATTNADASWQTTFTDDFNGTSLDTSKWSAVSGAISNYGSCMRTDPSHIEFSGSSLKLHTRKAPGTTCGGGSHPTNSTGAYIKSEIDGSNPKFAQAYGRFEIRAKLPTGAKGLWPAFWLRNGRGGWQDGEIDIFEQIGSSPSTLRSTLHWTPSDSRGHVQKVKDSTVSGLSSGFHTFQLEWTPCLMKVSVDGTVYNQWSNRWFDQSQYHTSFPEPFDLDGPDDVATYNSNGTSFPGGAMSIRLDNKLDSYNPGTQTLQPALDPANLSDASTPSDNVFEVDWIKVQALPTYSVPAGCPGA